MLIGIDVGGTFTDIVLLDPKGGVVEPLKLSSTPGRIEEGVIRGLSNLKQSWIEIERIVHGSTVATNSLLEGKWAHTALITTKGFKDILEIGRQQRPNLYDLSTERPKPLIPRNLRFEVPERLNYKGEVIVKLNEKRLWEIIEGLKDKKVESIAVSFLFSYVNPEHERKAKEILKELDVSITLSSEVLPEFREYERTSTTVISAALRPVVERYLKGLEERSSILGRRAWMVMQSDGGIMSSQEAKKRAVNLLLSGPAAGVEGARFVGEAAGFKDLITLDMGGTSCDVSLIKDGKVTVTTEGEICGYPVKVPMIDIHTIGAGGGSIAWIDAGGALRVGPQSAGADPGPACYGKGKEPTVTDAHLVLGRLNPYHPLGGLKKLDMEKARKAIKEKIADPLEMSLEDAAWGILEVADANMERAIRVISVERGHDPRSFVLLAFGGAGPLHGVSLAAKLGIPKVLIPRLAGVLSALGLLTADVTRSFVRSIVLPTENIDIERINSFYHLFRTQGRQILLKEGIPNEDIYYQPSVDMRYRGQSYELNLTLQDCKLTEDGLAELEQRFHKEHERVYGHTSPGEPTELVNLRLVARGRVPKPSLEIETKGNLKEAKVGIRDAFFNGWVECEVFVRERLPVEVHLEGPAIIESEESTILLPPEKRAFTDRFGNLIIEVGR